MGNAGSPIGPFNVAVVLTALEPSRSAYDGPSLSSGVLTFGLSTSPASGAGFVFVLTAGELRVPFSKGLRFGEAFATLADEPCRA